MTRTLLILAGIAVLTYAAQVTVTPPDDKAEVALQAAMRTETVDGDLKAAIRQYEAIGKGGNRTAAAKALVRMGHCYQKLGDNRAAGAAFQRVIHDFADQKDAVQEAQRSLPAGEKKSAADPVPDSRVAWYTGDWCHCARGLRNQIILQGELHGQSLSYSAQRQALVYEEFVVPEHGWTVVGVFSNNFMNRAGNGDARWEIRTGMAEGEGGKVVISESAPATVHQRTELDPEGNAEYEVRIDGLNLKLDPGRYWLAVAPITTGLVYIHPTIGWSSVGTRIDKTSEAIFDYPGLKAYKRFIKTDDAMKNFRHASMGIRIATGG